MKPKTAPANEAAPTITNKTISVTYGCKSPDGQHVYSENGRCLMCWQMKRDTDQTSRVLMIVISAENSERNRVDQLMDIVEAQVRGIFKTVAVTQGENRRLALPPKLELQVYA